MPGLLTRGQLVICVMSFTTLYQLEDPIDVVLGDGRALTAVGRGDVVLDMILPNGESKACTLHDVLYVPKLSYNLLSVAKASQKGKIVKYVSLLHSKQGA